jgi:hypothetical protein
MVTVDEAVAGLVPKVPVMPAGQPDVAKVTVELKPFAGLTVTVDVPDDAAAAVAGLALKEKLGCVDALTPRAMVVLADRVPLVPFTLSE